MTSGAVKLVVDDVPAVAERDRLTDAPRAKLAGHECDRCGRHERNQEYGCRQPPISHQ